MGEKAFGVIIMTDKELLTMAIDALENSYSPYSGCKVGTICAERVAVFKAISEGEKNFSKIAVVGGKDGIINGIFAPCGVCRQVLREFCSDDFQIILGESEKDFKVVTLKELLPLSFSPDNVR